MKNKPPKKSKNILAVSLSNHMTQLLTSSRGNSRPYKDFLGTCSRRLSYRISIFSLTTRTLCSSNSPSAIVSACADREIITDTPVSILKSIKNETEIKGMLEANIRSALCHSRLLKWAEDNADTGTISNNIMRFSRYRCFC